MGAKSAATPGPQGTTLGMGLWLPPSHPPSLRPTPPADLPCPAAPGPSRAYGGLNRKLQVPSWTHRPCQHLSPRGQTGTWAGPRTARLPPARSQNAWPLVAVAVPRCLRGRQQGSRSYALASVGSSAFSEGPRACWGWGGGGGSALGQTQPVSAGKRDHSGEGQNLYCDDGRSRHILCLLVSELNSYQLCHLAQVL